MCGICGIIRFDRQAVDGRMVQQMMRVMAHRGPDDQGLVLRGPVGLGVVRLSILDLSANGRQPMASADGRWVLVYNGEVYNFVELRSELQSKGYMFKSNSDTEVVLNSFIEWGVECLPKLIGMFSFAIYDNIARTVTLVRDRFGVKPFYFESRESTLIFASEIAALLSLRRESEVKINEQTMFDFLAFDRIDHEPGTFFAGIEKLWPGYYMVLGEGAQIAQRRWYSLSERLYQQESDAGDYLSVFKSSIDLTLRSDVPVGVSLSGGLDSSSIASVVSRCSGRARSLHTFSAVYGRGQRGDESQYISELAQMVEEMHFVVPTAQTLLTDIEAFVRAHSEPVPRTGSYAQFKVMELASSHVRVMLDGQGADEMLAGYDQAYGAYFTELMANRKYSALLAEMVWAISTGRFLGGVRPFLFQMLSSARQKAVVGASKSGLRDEFRQVYLQKTNVLEKFFNPSDLRSCLINMIESKLQHLLKWGDLNSMWFSIESRVPFLDHRLVERTLALPAQKIIVRGRNKAILREAMTGLVPERILRRTDKIGFGTPEADWFRTPQFKALINDILNSKWFKENPFLEPSVAMEEYDGHVAGRHNAARRIWKWINLYFWHEIFFRRGISDKSVALRSVGIRSNAHDDARARQFDAGAISS